jgi:hypothetical protein
MAWNSFFSGFKDGWDTSMDMSNGGSGLWAPSFFNGLFEGIGSWWHDLSGQASNEKINAENLAMQQKNLDYQKALQQEIFNREDTAYQRTRADMYNAGMNPLSMKSTNNAGAVVPTQAPQKQFESVNAIPLITQALTELNSLSVGQAQRDNINAQTRALELENAFTEWNLGNRKNRSNSETNITRMNSYNLSRDFYNNVLTGQSSNQFLSTINQSRIAMGKKPIDTENWVEHSDIDFNELVDQARYGLTMDMIDKIGNLIPKGSIKIGK